MTVFSGFSTAWRFAGSPTRIPSFLKARLAEGLRQIVTDHPDPLARLAGEGVNRGVHLVEDGEEPCEKVLVGELDDRLGVSLHALSVVFELRLQVSELRQELPRLVD